MATWPFARDQRSGLLRLGLWSALLAGLCGCSLPTPYERIELGRPWKEYASLIPAGQSIRLSNSLMHREPGRREGERSLLVMLDRAERTTARFTLERVTADPARDTPAAATFIARVDRVAAGFGDTGPLDTLRAIVVELAEPPALATAGPIRRDVAAGLVRILEAQGEQVGPGVRKSLADSLDRLPGGGDATIDGTGGILTARYHVLLP